MLQNMADTAECPYCGKKHSMSPDQVQHYFVKLVREGEGIKGSGVGRCAHCGEYFAIWAIDKVLCLRTLRAEFDEPNALGVANYEERLRAIVA